MVYPVEALYVPKSVTVRRDADAFVITMKAASLKGGLLGAALILFAFLALPVMLIMAKFSGLLIFLAALVAGFLLFKTGSPELRISSAGVEVSGRLYRMEDASHFNDNADDSWVPALMARFGLNHLALAYGIYNVHLPYILSAVEMPKVAVLLTSILKSQGVDHSEDRERKVQQAQMF